jgi:hypothetical protein
MVDPAHEAARAEGHYLLSFDVRLGRGAEELVPEHSDGGAPFVACAVGRRGRLISGRVGGAWSIIDLEGAAVNEKRIKIEP